MLSWAVKGAAGAVGVSGARSLGTATAAAGCASGERHCGKACYTPFYQQCCKKGKNPVVCGDASVERCCGNACCFMEYSCCGGTHCCTPPDIYCNLVAGEEICQDFLA